MSRIIAVLSRTAAAHRRIIAVMSRIYCDYFGLRHLIGDDYTAILLLLTTVSDDFTTVALRFFLIGEGIYGALNKRNRINVSYLFLLERQLK